MAQLMPIRVLTVDSLPVIHAGVRQLLVAFPDIQVVGEAYDMVEAARLGRARRPDIVLVEIDDLGPEWPAALRQLAAAGPGAVVVFACDVSPERVRQALHAGARSVLLKNTQPLTLAHALRSIAAGQQVFAPEVSHAILMSPPEPGPRDDLSTREREVLALLARGLSNQEIGRRLYVSRATVKFHCTNIFTKLGVRTRAQAVAAAYSRNLVPRLVADHDLPAAARGPVAHEPRARSA